MALQQLRTLVKVLARGCSVSRAVEELHISQPSVSIITPLHHSLLRLRHGQYLRGLIDDFIARVAPQWTRMAVDRALREGRAAEVRPPAGFIP